MPQPKKPAPFDTLTIAEFDVIEAVLGGYRQKDIAIQLGRHYSTVSEQRKAAFKKLSVRSDVDLAKLALRVGLIQL